jgi:hypothetical protein
MSTDVEDVAMFFGARQGLLRDSPLQLLGHEDATRNSTWAMSVFARFT